MLMEIMLNPHLPKAEMMQQLSRPLPKQTRLPN